MLYLYSVISFVWIWFILLIHGAIASHIIRNVTSFLLSVKNVCHLSRGVCVCVFLNRAAVGWAVSCFAFGLSFF